MNELRVSVRVTTGPARAFALFTDEVDAWWRRGERYGGPEVTGHRFEPHVGGRFLELQRDRESPLGTVTIWDPPSRLAFTWRQGNWSPGEITEVTVTFTPVEPDATDVTLVHRGFAQVHSDVGCEVGYQAGWQELLGWFRESVNPTKESVCT